MLNKNGAVIKKLDEIIDFLHRPFENGYARCISILLGLSLTFLLLFNLNHAADYAANLGVTYFTFILIALSASFIHGLGFYPRFWFWKLLFSPYLYLLILLTFTVFIFI